MICYECKAENRDGARVCRQCGTVLTISAPSEPATATAVDDTGQAGQESPAAVYDASGEVDDPAPDNPEPAPPVAAPEEPIAMPIAPAPAVPAVAKKRSWLPGLAIFVLVAVLGYLYVNRNPAARPPAEVPPPVEVIATETLSFCAGLGAQCNAMGRHFVYLVGPGDIWHVLDTFPPILCSPQTFQANVNAGVCLVGIGWNLTPCAQEGQHCNFSGTRWVLWGVSPDSPKNPRRRAGGGAQKRFAMVKSTKSQSCTAGAFGEVPDPSGRRSCYLLPDMVKPPNDPH